MKKSISVKDHSVSGEVFTLLYDADYHMYITHPKPTLEEVPSYYESENYISHTDGKRSFFEYLYQFVKGITLSRKQKLLKRYHAQLGFVLDIGAGTGDFIHYLKNKKWEVSGVEPSPKARALAEKKGHLLVNTIEQLGEHEYDVITMWHVLEHIYDLESQIKWIKSHLKKEGTIFIAVPNFESYDAIHYSASWAAYDVPRHLYHFSKKAITKLFKEESLTVVEILPMTFDSYYVSLLSEKYKNGKGNFFKAFITGWRSNHKARRTKNYSSLIYVIKHKKT